MSFDSDASDRNSVLPNSKRMRKGKTEPVSSCGHTSEETLVSKMPRKSTKEKNATRNSTHPAQQKAKEKISDQVAQIFAVQLADGTKFVDSSAILEKFIAPHKVASTTSAETTIHIVTTVTEKTKTTRKSTTGQEDTSSTIRTMKSKYKISGSIYSLDDLSAITALQHLVDRFGKVSHMGILDKSYTFFINKSRTAAVYFKVHDKVAVVGGDPLCEPERFDSLLKEFAMYRKAFGWNIAFLGATSTFASFAREKKWPTLHFGVERVLNPLTNPVLEESGAGKRIISNSKALLKKNVSLGIYIPRNHSDPALQAQLVDIYSAWCADRNNKPIIQAYMTIMDPFAMPDLMVYIYTRDISTGVPNGFAALRKIVNGYHLDPCIALPGSARGISELLILSSMALLRGAGVSYLSLGFEPSTELGEITGIPNFAQGLTRSFHRHAYRGLPIGGKQAFFDKFRPDDNQQGDLYLVIPTRGLPSLRHMKALMHTANINISKLVFEDVKKSLAWRSGEHPGKTTEQGEARSASEESSSSESSGQESSTKSSEELTRSEE